MIPHSSPITIPALPITILIFLPLVQGSGQLSEEELRMVFGDQHKVPEYSVFEPRVMWAGEGEGEGEGVNVGEGRHRYTRSINDTTSDQPILQFNALGKSFNFRLHRNNDLVSRDFVFVDRDGDKVNIYEVLPEQLQCLYQGHTQEKDSTLIAVELCGEVRGVMASPTEEYVIEPLPQAITTNRQRRSSYDAMPHPDAPPPTHLIYARKHMAGYSVDAKSRNKRSRQTFNENNWREQRRGRADVDEERWGDGEWIGGGRSGGSGGDGGWTQIGGDVGEKVMERGELGGREEIRWRQQRRSYYDSFEHLVDSRLRSDWVDHYDQNDRSRGRDESDVGSSDHVRRDPDDGDDLYIETSVFVDQDLYRHMMGNFPHDTQDKVLAVVLAMVNAVQLLYNDPSLGHSVKFVLKRLEILHQDPPGLARSHDIDHFLTNFCTWQRGQNPNRDSDPLHWDHALILTGLDVFTITSKGRVNSQVVGLAPVAGMCTRASFCTVNEGRHFESVYVMAHEIGHNLGMRHDGLQAGNNCDSGRYIMSPTLGSGKITWSPCSRRYLQDFLRSRQSWCLEDRASPQQSNLDHHAHSLPGQRFPANQQCLLKHGVGSEHAPTQALEDICQDLHCRRDHYTWTSHPALEGTTCGHRMWCQRGRCVEDPNAPPLSPSSTPSSFTSSSTSPLGGGGNHGGVRGEWGPWSECRSDCLYGVDGILSSGSSGLALSERRCRTCHGEYRYRLCLAAEECSMRQRRTLQDFAHDTCRTLARSSALLTGTASRVPDRGPMHCEVECEMIGGRGVEATGRSFPDGTVCHSQSSLPAFCVAGACTEFRCEPDALYGADPHTCRPDMGAPDPHRPLGPQRPSPSNIWVSTTTAHNFRNPKWGPWKAASTCRFSCLRPAKGIQLVSRECSGRGCTGVSRNIQICTPPNPLDCDKLQTPFEYASEVCDRFKSNVDKLSGLGMQLASTGDDPDRPCTVACQDGLLDYRFYRVNGRDGWFPFGTDCSRERGGTLSYCLNGKCLDFSDEGTPLRNTIYTENDRSNRGRSLDLVPIERGVPFEMHHSALSTPWHSWRGRRDVTSSSHILSTTLTDQLLLSLVDQINYTMTSRARVVEEPSASIDFKNPLFVSPAQDPATSVFVRPPSFPPLHDESNGGDFGSIDEEGDDVEFRWKVEVVSPCSVTCGYGYEEVTATCMRLRKTTEQNLKEEEEEEVWRCSHIPPPVVPGYRRCHKRRCPLENIQTSSKSFMSRWMSAILNDVINSGSHL